MVDGEHREGFLALYREVLGGAKAERLQRRFDWQYRQSPARRPDQDSSWVVVHQGRVIGHMSVTHVRMQVGDARWQGCWANDYLIHPAYRRRQGGDGLYALAPELDRAAEMPMGYGMAEVVGRAFKRRGYVRLAVGSHLIRFSTAAGALRLRGGTGARNPMRIAARVGGTLRHLLRHLGRSRAVPDRRGWEVELANPGDGSEIKLEGLWRRIAGGYPVAAVRDRRHLAWRYGRPQAPARLLLLRRHGRLEAAAVLEALSWRGLRVGQISDLLVPRSEAPALVPVVSHFTSQVLARQGVDAILTEGFPADLRRALAGAGFHEHVAGRREIAVVLNRDRRLPDELVSDPDNWLLTAGDSDRSTPYPRLRWVI